MSKKVWYFWTCPSKLSFASSSFQSLATSFLSSRLSGSRLIAFENGTVFVLSGVESNE